MDEELYFRTDSNTNYYILSTGDCYYTLWGGTDEDDELPDYVKMEYMLLSDMYYYYKHKKPDNMYFSIYGYIREVAVPRDDFDEPWDSLIVMNFDRKKYYDNIFKRIPRMLVARRNKALCEEIRHYPGVGVEYFKALDGWNELWDGLKSNSLLEI